MIVAVAWDFDGSGRFVRRGARRCGAEGGRGAPALVSPSPGPSSPPYVSWPDGTGTRPARLPACRTWHACGWSWSATRRRRVTATGAGQSEFLVDRPHMATDRLLDMVGRPGGPLADAALWHLEVVEVGRAESRPSAGWC